MHILCIPQGHYLLMKRKRHGMEGMELFWEPGEKCEAAPTTLRDEPKSPSDPNESARQCFRL